MKVRSYEQKVRGLRFLLTEKQKYEELEEFAAGFRKAFHAVSKHIFHNYSEMKTYNSKHRPGCPSGADKETRQQYPMLKRLIQDEVDEQIKACGILTHRRNIVLVALSNYGSYKKRNKKFPAKPLSLTVSCKTIIVNIR